MPGLKYGFTFRAVEMTIFVLPAEAMRLKKLYGYIFLKSNIRIDIVNNFKHKFYNLIEEEIT